MYVDRVEVRNLRSIEHAVVEFGHPERADPDDHLPNVNVLLGDNGTGKTTILGAIALGCLAEVIDSAGFRPFYLVRRTGELLDEKARPGEVVVDVRLHAIDGFDPPRRGRAGLAIEPLGSFEKLRPLAIREPEVAGQDRWTRIFEDQGKGFLLLGYGATRRTDRSETFDPSAVQKSRAMRYHRVAGLFEDHLALVPLSAWLARIWRGKSNRAEEAVALINATLPSGCELVDLVHAKRRIDFSFRIDGDIVPFWALSDGYRAFVGLVSDLLYHLTSVAGGGRLTDIPGIVLIDEIDLHLHPSWQREVVTRLCQAFPRLQFVLTTHSAIVAGTVPPHRLQVFEKEPGGQVVVKRPAENIFGQSADQILLSRYFGLRSTRAPAAEASMEKLAQKTMTGDQDAALQFLKMVSGDLPAPPESEGQPVDHVSRAPERRRKKVRRKVNARTPSERKAAKKTTSKKTASKRKAGKKKAGKKKASKTTAGKKNAGKKNAGKKK